MKKFNMQIIAEDWVKSNDFLITLIRRVCQLGNIR